MKVWITCFILLFGMAELLQWVQKLSLPLPIFILGGAFLAIASNYDKLTNLPFHPDFEIPELPDKEAPEKPTLDRTTPIVQSSPNPPIAPMAKAARSQAETISFTISKPHQPGD
ncbi:MAG TPA: hypothetical protein V6D18_11960 [Thermosynechococcaceae cyanobacterium]